MKSVILRAILLLLLVSIAVAHPKPIPDDDASGKSDSHESQEVMSSENHSSEETDNHASQESEETSAANSEMIGFNLALFPRPGIFERLRETLSSIRDQLNSMWHMSTDPSFFNDIPDDYKNSTLKNEVINGSLMTLNETVYKLTEENGIQSVYHIQVISLHPNGESDLTEQMSQQVSVETEIDDLTTTETTLDDILSTTEASVSSESS